LSLPALLNGHARFAIDVLVVGIGSFGLFAHLRIVAARENAEALTSGELRDRLFALAAAAKVRLRQVYVLPMRRARIANAFAVRRDVVLVTDHLLENLSRREVDAVLAHEISHLRHGHPQKLAFALVGAVTIAVFLPIPLPGLLAIPVS